MEERIVRFVNALRSKGVRVSLAESEDAFRAIDFMGVTSRETFRLALRSTLIKNQEDLPLFDDLFALFFETLGVPPMESLPDDLSPEEARMLSEALQAFNRKLRQMLEKIMRGEPLSLEELAQLNQLVGLQHAADPRFQQWMRRRMERALKFPEVQEAIRDMLAILSEMGMSPERLEQMRELMQENFDSIRQQLNRFAGERIAENMTRQNQENELDSLYQRAFNSLTDADLERLRHEVTRLAAVLRTRIALRQKRAKTGQLDAKATIRSNLKHEGVPFEIKFRNRKKKPKLVIFCDISTSMRSMSELMLSLVFALQDLITKTHAFVFIDHLEYITPILTGHSARDAVQQVLARMPSGHYNTDLGYSLQNFEEQYMDLVDRRTTFIMVGDGRNNYNDPRLDIFSNIARRSNRTFWLNPEQPYLWLNGDSDMPVYSQICDKVLIVGSLGELSTAIDSLLAF